MHVRIVQVCECRLESVVQVAQIEAVVPNLVRFKAYNPILNLLQFHFVDEIARHGVSLDLFLQSVLQVAAKDVENAVFEGETVANSALVAHSGDQNVLSFGNCAGDHPTDVFQVGFLHEDNQEHLVHRNESVCLVNVFEAELLEVDLHV